MLNFDNWLTVYTSAGFLLVLIFSFFYLRIKLDPKPRGNNFDWLWALGFFGILLLMRYPFIAYNQEMDADESQMLTQAMSLEHYWIYWKYVDGLTQGPLVSYLLILPSWLGMPFDYTSARLVGFVLLSLTLMATFLTLRNLFSRPVSLIAFTPIAFLYILSQGAFSILYNEYVVLFLLAFCFWFFSVLYRQPQPGFMMLFLIGFLSGMVPFGKLQGVPTALLIVVFTGIIVLQRSTEKIKALAMLAIGGFLFPLIVLCLTIKYGALEYFWKFYVVGNMEYSSGGSIWEKALNYPDFLSKSGQFSYMLLIYVLLTFAGIWLLLRSGALLKSLDLLFWFGLLHVATAFYVIIKSGYQFSHYQQFMIIPLGVFAGVVVEAALKNRTWSAQKIRALSIAFMLICILPHTINKIATTTGNASVGYTLMTTEDLGKPILISPVATEILRYTHPGDNITIWGWFPAYHLQTKLIQGTADVISFRQLSPSPQLKSYQLKYLNDLKRNRPAVFVDLITMRSFWFQDPARYSHEQIPGISDFIAQNYQQVSTVEGERIYVRNDRLAAVR